MDDETVANNSTSERFFSPHTTPHLPSVCVFYVHREKYNRKEWRNERKKQKKYSMKRCVIADIDSAVKRKID